MKITVIIPAAGIGQRFSESNLLQDAKTKLEMDLGGKPVFIQAVECFTSRADVNEVLLAVHPDKKDEYQFKYGDALRLKGAKIVAGSTKERWETIQKAMGHVKPETTHVAIHDAARPLITQKLITRLFDAAKEFDAVIPGLPASATLKRVSGEVIEKQEEGDAIDDILGIGRGAGVSARMIEETVDRSEIVEAQTPQVFEAGVIREAYERVARGEIDESKITDDACLLELLGKDVYVVEGESSNLKITTAEDLTLAQAIVKIHQQSKSDALGKKRLFDHAEDDDLF